MKPSFVRLLVSLSALAFASAAYSADASRNATAPASEADVAASAPRLVLPPPIPPMSPLKLAPVFPPPPPSAASVAGQQAVSTQGASSPAAQPDVKRVFLTRDELKEKREGCDVSRKGSEKATALVRGGELTVRYSVTGGPSCIAAAGADSDWADVAGWEDGVARIEVEPNVTGDTRQTTVTLTTANGKRATYLITQAGTDSPHPLKRNRKQ